MDYRAADFGAAGTGMVNDTAAVQAAIDAAHAAGGGRVVLENGHTYLTDSLVLRSHVELHLEGGSVLKATPELDAYLRPDQPAQTGHASSVGTPVNGKPSYVYLYARDAEDVQITGFGRIDGTGDAFVHRVSPYYITGSFYPRPTLVYFEHCSHVTFRDVTMGNVPFWTLHVAGCYDVLMQGIRILNSLEVANSDGIDVDHSQQVRILGCHVECADDCICMKNTRGNREYPHTSEVIVSDCTLISTSAAIKIGTEGVDDFTNILFSRCVITHSNRGVSVQIRDEGCVRNVNFEDIIIETRRFCENWWGCAEPIAVTALDRDEHTRCGTIEDVRFRRITCRGENGVLLWGQEGKLRNILLDQVDVRLEETSKWPKHMYDLRPGATQSAPIREASVPVWARHVEELTLHRVRTQGFDGTKQQAEHLRMENCADAVID